VLANLLFCNKIIPAGGFMALVCQKLSVDILNFEKEKKMPKMKTHKSAAKRYKVTASGKITRRQAGIGHLLQHKSASRKRRIFKTISISKSHFKLISKELPYKKYSR